ncbi:trypsin-like serine peptidase [Actinocorallia populi]|uniref:trypsin-like serine peptidase n=1 Tax=Actinocorallia populi TaxID=2079200 RepID=UPI0013006D93|nr:hypothetical protein [Actinocorallia populi]
MKSRRTLGRVVIALGAVASLLVAVPANAAADFYELPRFVPAGSGFQAKLASEINYWTIEKLSASDNAGLNDDTVEYRTEATPPPGGWDQLSAPWTGGGSVSRTVGRLFVRMRGTLLGDHIAGSCSANVVNAANKSTIVAAAHCFKVSSQLRGVPWGDDIAFEAVFIPGFNGASLVRDSHDQSLPGPDIAPYGVWGVTRAFYLGSWESHDNWLNGGDVAMATVARPGDPTPIADVVGSQNIAFGVDTNPHHAYQFGYPVSNSNNWYWTKLTLAPEHLRRSYDGRTMMYAHGTTYDDAQLLGYGHDMLSAMAPGSSGGPWFIDFDPATGTGTQIAVTSRFTNEAGNALAAHPDNSVADWGRGPASVGGGFGTLSQAMYNHVKNTTP